MPPGKYHLPQKELKDRELAAAVAAVEAAAKDRRQGGLGEFAEGKKADGTLVDKPSEQAKTPWRPSARPRRRFQPVALARSWCIRRSSRCQKSNLQSLRKVAENDYNSVIISLVDKYCPPGLLGLALTALLASFMSGMAGNVTAFNTVWTYDLYQAYIAPNRATPTTCGWAAWSRWSASC